jgi:formylglycine-generating enzyme required for sulfatase activity
VRWVQAQPASGWLVQHGIDSDVGRLIELRRSYPRLSESRVLALVRSDGRLYFALVSGPFDSPDTARNFIKDATDIPSLPWVRSIASVVRELEGRRDLVASVSPSNVSGSVQTSLIPGTAFRDCAECPEMVVIPQGTFQMGSPNSEAGRGEYEGPVREVRIGYTLAVGKFEVTRREFGRFTEATGYRTEAERNVAAQGCVGWSGSKFDWVPGLNWRSPGFDQVEDHPVVCVSWNDAQAYLKWLNDSVPGRGYRLLSEAEWEYAARAGRGSTRFPWGDDTDDRDQCRWANGADQTAKAHIDWYKWKVAYCSDEYAYTAPVGRFRVNAFGLHDMLGNALEWVQDVWHGSYEGAPSDGSAWVSGGDQSRRVLRGGSWGGTPQFLRSADRIRYAPGNRGNSTGFRIARTF